MGMLPGAGDSLSKLHSVLEMVYPPVLALARAHGLPVIDLPRTFDVTDGDLYRCQIEPSHKGGGLIASLIAEALSRHDFTSGESALYYIPIGGDGGVVRESNDGSKPWRVVV